MQGKEFFFIDVFCGILEGWNEAACLGIIKFKRYEGIYNVCMDEKGMRRESYVEDYVKTEYVHTHNP